MGIIAAGQITVVDLSDAPVLNAFITASRPTTQTYSKDSRNYNPSYASTPQVLTLNVTKSGSTTSIINSISGLHWYVVDGPVKTEITSKVNTSNEYISGNYNEILTTKLNIDTNKGYRHYEATGVWHDPSTDLDVQFSANINLLLTQNGATGPQGPQGATGNGIANTVVTYGLSMSDTTEPATWSSDRPALVKGMYLWIRTVIIYTNGKSTTSYQISYIPKDADATAAIDKTKQELLEKLETVRDDSLEAVEEAKQQLVTVRDESLAAAEEAKQQLTTVANDLSKAKTDLQNAVNTVDTKATNVQNDLSKAKQQVTTVANDLSKAKTDLQNAVNTVDTKATNVQNDLSKAKQDLASQAQKLQEQANAQSKLTNRVSSVEETANGTKTTVSELSKTVAQNGKDITSVTARTKVVEDDLAGTKTTLSQVKTTADSTSQKAATLESGLNGLSAKFDNLKIGSRNYFKDSKSRKYYIDSTGTQDVRTFIDDDFWKNDTRFTKDYVRMSFDIAFNPALPTDFATNVHFSASPWYNCGGITFKGGTTALQHFDLKFNLSGAGDSYKTDNIFIRLNNTLPLNTAVSLENFNLYLSAVVEDYSSNDADIEQKIAEYKQNADQNYASLQSTVQNLDGTVQHNKTIADQTAQGFTTRIESLETYKSGESERANKYFELAKTETARQLSVERTAIAKDYVAKSTYTSDVTGIRNELSATTTTANTIKTNLANYQATNDKVVASLKSSLQTTDGKVSNLQTKVEAVPGQITSAVSAVESKIPTEIGTVNLLNNSKSFNGSNITGTGTISSETYQGCSVRYYAGADFCDIAQFSNCVVPKVGSTYVASFWAKGSGKVRTYFYGNSNYLGVETGTTNQNASTTANDGAVDFSLTANWQRYWVVYKLRPSFPTSDTTVAKHLLFRHLQNGASTDNIHIAGVKLEEGNVASGYEPSPTDTAEQISSLSSQIKQTADGITLLATKTELSTAKTELQSGINTATNKANNAQATANNNAQTISTHTTQISALNTGLSAKVSQTDFNTLSGRVTTAENNITAKANELSSKITSVEGKIPSGEMNLVEYGRPANGYSPYSDAQYTTHGFYYNSAYKMYIIRNTSTSEKTLGLNLFKVERNTEYTLYFKGFNNGNITNMDVWFLKRVNGSKNDWDSAQQLVIGRKFSVSRAEDVSVTFNTGNYDEGYLRFDNNGTTTAGTQADLYFGDVSVKKGKSNNGWSPSLAELASSQDLKTAQSEIKQTQDGMTLLATKTEVSNAKTELQSGITTATNKANNNAQIINTHTTQISALNTGLQAKVSQTEFNTLSGRVTSAENNITAKANELSSKITSVEGKIPTSVDTVNLVKGTGSAFVMGYGITNTTWNETKKQSILDFSAPGVRRDIGSEILPQRDPFFNFKPIKGVTYTQSIMIDTDATFNPNGQAKCTWFTNNGHNQQKAYIKKVGEHSYQVWSTYTWNLENTPLRAFDWYDLHTVLLFRTTGTYLAFYKPKLTAGNLPSDWSPSPEDYDDALTRVSSQIKQTADGITLLATKTELNSAKTELQSGINTATNKANNAQTTANNAQSKANSNAQTINTHTTQISALNTGLQAKVSQTEFNTLSGRVTTAENNITAKANELSSKITSVEGKIPTEMGSSNLLRNTAVNTDNLKLFETSNSTINVATKDGHQTYKIVVTANGSGANFKGNAQYYNLIKNRTYTFSFWALTNKDKPYSFNSLGHIQVVNENGDLVGSDRLHQHSNPIYSTNTIKANTWTKVWCTFKATSNSYFRPFFWYLNSGDEIYIYDMMLNEGNIPLSYTPAPEDAISQISTLSSELKQTQNGITLLATKTELSTAKNELQSGINTATNKANAAQNTANSAQTTANNAQSKANSNAQTISTHTTQISALNTGLNAKVSQSDFNTLSGRVTTAENNITAKANELSSKISSVEGKLPSGEINLVEYGRPADAYSPYAGAEYTTHSFYYNSAYKMYIIRNTSTSEKLFGMNRFKVERNTEYTLYFKGFNNGALTNMDVWFLKRVRGSSKDFDSAQILVGGRKLSVSRAEDISVTFNTGNYDEGYLRFDNNGTTTAGSQAELYFGDVSVKKGRSNNGWSPSLAELASSQDLKNAQSEFKQTTDSIKASVSSLDKSTVKSSSLTINADGIVMKAGKSTTDVANAIGSYFAVNQNAINLFSDRINVKGSMIVNGTITGDKIKASSVDVSKIVGIDANFIKSKIEHAMIDWLKGKTITAYNNNMTIDLQNGRISFKDGTNAVYRQTPDGIHTGFLHFDSGSLGGIYAAFGATSTREGVNSRSSAFAGIRCYRVSKYGDSHEAKIDKIEIVGDTVQFGHGYTSDGSIAMGGGFIMDNAAFSNETPYSLNRVVKSIESLWRILHDHAKNTGYRFNDPAFINALNNEYNAWHELHNM